MVAFACTLRKIALLAASLFAICTLALVVPQGPALADPASGAPQTTGGLGVFDALQKRTSAKGGDFSAIPIDRDALATVLWSATGRNRGGSGWVIPTFEGAPPYVAVYVAGPDGVFRYDGEDGSFERISDEDVRDRLGHQSFVRRSYNVLIFVADAKALSQFSPSSAARDYALIALGAMTQNVYLACASLKLDTRYISMIETEEIRGALGLSDADEPLALMLLGK